MPVITRTERQVAVRGTYLPDLPENGGHAIGESIASLVAIVACVGRRPNRRLGRPAPTQRI